MGLCQHGIIPAYAGSTDLVLHNQSILPGSSPRMRGARVMCYGTERQERIIPAYAGSTEGFYQYLAAVKDHPRVCGEHRNSL